MSSADLLKSEPKTAPLEKKLEYLRFLEVAALHVLFILGRWYDFAKDMTGPLKPLVERTEGIVKKVAGPIYSKALDVPIGILMYADGKISESVTELDRHMPPELMLAAHIAPFAAQSISSEYRRAGFVVAATGYCRYMYFVCEPKARELYHKYLPIVEQYAVQAWHRLQRIPLFPKLAQLIILPIASLCTKMYNEAVESTAKKGLRVSSYLPLVPIEAIINLFTNEPALAFDY